MRKLFGALLITLAPLLALSEPSKSFTLEEIRLFAQNYTTSFRIDENGEFNPSIHTKKGYGFTYSAENIPFIPDVRLNYTHTHSAGTKELEEDLTVGDTTYEKGTVVRTKISGDDIKISFYYQPIDKFNYEFINLELGLNLLFVDYKIKRIYRYKGSEGSTEDTVSTLLPGLHVKVTLSPTYYLNVFVRGTLPFSGKRKSQEIEGGIEYFINPQLFLFGSYSYALRKVSDINDITLKESSKAFTAGVGLIW